VAGHVGLELRNVGNNYPFERSRRFPEILANSSPTCAIAHLERGDLVHIALGQRDVIPTVEQAVRRTPVAPISPSGAVTNTKASREKVCR